MVTLVCCGRKCYRCGPEADRSEPISPATYEAIIVENPLEPCEEGFVTDPDKHIVNCQEGFEGCMKGWIETDEGLRTTRSGR